MVPVVCVVATGELGEGPSAENGWVIGAEGGVDHQATVKHQEGVVDALEGIVVHTLFGEVEEHLRGQRKFSRTLSMIEEVMEMLHILMRKDRI